MDAAITAGADKYAVADMDAATKLWDTAEAQVKDKKYEEAKKTYADAKAAFEKAPSGVEEGKKVARAEATAALKDLGASWKDLRASAKKVEKKMKDQKEDWEADIKTFDEGLKAGKDMIASDPAGAKEKVTELKDIIERWDANFKELTAAPAPPEEKKENKGKK
jgi:archaellum component FlaC